MPSGVGRTAIDVAAGPKGNVYRLHVNQPSDIVSSMLRYGDYVSAKAMLSAFSIMDPPDKQQAANVQTARTIARTLWLRLEFCQAIPFLRQGDVHPLELLASMPNLMP